ncbi:SusD/RagB family nutrient-binding outer membrane lipoprotein [Rapidithrix thailandica]|uniref:SusD/RagB family nutrient-binding outer membrane lipoprotein n=1 Tax=Rapidithrix thailandica TaxID=413964 RepID=A0AAW9S532_9BACT
MNIKNTLLMLMSAFMVFACTSDFEEINSDPNRIQESRPENLMAPALYELNRLQMRSAHRLSHEFMQYSVQTNEINEFHRFVIPTTESNYLWENYYTTLTDVQDILLLGEKNEAPNYIAVAKVLRAWIFSNLTDMFGPIPFTEALKGYSDKIYQPAFDSQETIYKALLADLEEANTLFDEGKPINAESDLLFSGSVNKWRKFANSLRLRLLMRVEKKAVMNVQAQIKVMFDNPDKYPVFSSNEEAAVMYYSENLPFVNPLSKYREFEFNGNRGLAEAFINTLKTFNDPRLELIATKTSEEEYTGVVSARGKGEGIPESYSTYRPELQATTQSGIIFPYAEVEFLWAEAALKGWINSDAAAHYQKGIEASMAYWGAEMPGDYMNRPGVTFDNQLGTLIRQKWIALFFCGFESWYDYRRTGYPVLAIGGGAENDGIVPTRMPYPSTLQSLNATNYQKAVEMLGADDLQVKCWWMK